MRSALYILICLSLCACAASRRMARDDSAEVSDTFTNASNNQTVAAVNAPLSISPRQSHVSLVTQHTAGKQPSNLAEADSVASNEEVEDVASEIVQTSGEENPEPAALPFPDGLELTQLESPTEVENVEPQPDPETVEPQPLLIPSEPEPAEPQEVENQSFPSNELMLAEVIDSVYASYPKLEAALFQRNVTQGERLSASGAFDLKIKGASENGPLGFYETYRQSLGFNQPTYGGGEFFGGYRIGRGDFEPWYKERETNGGGEFKVGAAVPLAQNRAIDGRRAELWKSDLEVQLTEPDIQAQLIGFVQQASYAYWDWVAAGQQARVAAEILELAESRTERIRRQVEVELLDPPELTDNLRLVAERKAKLADAQRKFQQKAAKLSLYHRDAYGRPVVPVTAELPDFPVPVAVAENQLEADIQQALRARPEIMVFDFQRRQYEIDYSQACNNLLPELDAVVQGKQDMGEPTSKKRDKSQFELEASLFLEVPLQRRKARGKIQAVQGKLAQLSAKRRLMEDQIVVDVQQAFAALIGAYKQVEETTQAVAFAEELARRERRNFEEGASDLLKVTLREQYAVESANKRIDALLLYYLAQADYRAALAIDRQP